MVQEAPSAEVEEEEEDDPFRASAQAAAGPTRQLFTVKELLIAAERSTW